MNNKNKKEDLVRVMIGSGCHAIIATKKRGEKYMRRDGTFVRAGETTDDFKKRMDDKINKMVINKPSTLAKKLSRILKKDN